MKIRTSLIALGIATLATGCQNLNTETLMQSGAQAFQAATLSNNDVKALSDKSCAEMDSKAQIAPADSTYAKRLNKIAAALGDNINGTPANYKVYVTKDVNAWAMANGCIRVYSGLMDMMNDNEVEGVLGHEMGHVALGHTRKAMQVAYGTVALRTAASSAGGVIGSLSQSQLADIGEKLVSAQFSQKQESEADDYSFDLLKSAASIRTAWPPASRSWPRWKPAARAACSTTTLLPKRVRSTSAIASRQRNNHENARQSPGVFIVLIQRFLRRPGEGQRPNLFHVHLDHRRPRVVDRFGQHAVELCRCVHLPGFQPHRFGDLGESRRVQLVVILAPGEVLVLNAAHHAITAVVHDQQGDIHLFLRHGRQLAQAQRQTTVAHQPHHLALRVGNRGADGHRQPHTDGARQRVNVAQRRDRPEQPAAPDAAGNGDIAYQQPVLRQRGIDGVVEFGVFTGLLAQRALRLPHRPRDLGIPLGIDLLAGASRAASAASSAAQSPLICSSAR